ARGAAPARALHRRARGGPAACAGARQRQPHRGHRAVALSRLRRDRRAREGRARAPAPAAAGRARPRAARRAGAGPRALTGRAHIRAHGGEAVTGRLDDDAVYRRAFRTGHEPVLLAVDRARQARVIAAIRRAAPAAPLVVLADAAAAEAEPAVTLPPARLTAA